MFTGQNNRTWSKLKRMTLGLGGGVLRWGIGGPNHASLSLESSHNTFTNFYLKDLTWSDNDNNMYLGPVVAAQQVLDTSPQTRHPRKEKKGGGGHIRYNQVFRSLIPGARYRFTSQDVMGKVIFYFIFSYQVYMY